VIIDEEEYLAHYGTARKSGRYPWGSGGTENQQNKSFLDHVDTMRKQGLTDTEIAKGLDMTRTALQAKKTMAKNEQKQTDITTAQRLKAKGMGNMAIGRQMNLNESSVRSLLAPGQMAKAQALMSTANMLKRHVDEKGVIDVGSGVEHHLGLSRDRLDKAIEILRQQDYYMTNVQIDQLGTGGNQKTNIKVLALPGTTYRDIVKDKSSIKSVTDYTDDGGLSWSGLRPPLNINSNRVQVRYKEQGGGEADGVIYVRRGVDDLSLGTNRYAQVRVAVDGTHYLKGMAMYKDDMPKGADLVFNTVKSDTGNKRDAMKKMQIDNATGKIDEGNPFGAVIGRQIKELGPDGKERCTSVMNMVNEEGQWDKWSRNLSSQMLSKQSPALAKTQLDMTYEKKKLALDEISALTNPVVRAKLLQSFADSADSSAVHLKAAAMPRQSSHVILPVPGMKENEIFAPNFDNGTRVALIRYPHGGIFEIPELTVNNKHAEANKLLHGAIDAVGISAKVAERLSGADFDGDTVLVIPNGRGEIKTAPPLARLVHFDPKTEYPKYDGMQLMTVHAKGTHMGEISNLITDMTIKGASPAELARAVRHSMVVIDAEKHSLDYKRSAVDHGIKQLKTKYQENGTGNRGASTIISRATARTDILAKKPRPMADGGPIDKKTGALVFVPTGEHYTRTTVSKKGVTKETVIYKKQRSQKLIEETNAHNLVSDKGGTKIEKIYADHSNKLKALANTARLEMVHTKTHPISLSAKAAYKPEVISLGAKLTLAQRNAPLERQAQVLANSVIEAKKASNANMEKAELKKIKFQALEAMRARTGADKQKIVITPTEWAAIQAGAISNDRLGKILDHADLDVVKALATPRVQVLMTSAKKSKAASMAVRGYTQAEIAAALGVSLTTLKTNI